MKLWALLARYRLHSGEFQVRVPLGCPRRAKVAHRLFGGRVERGTVVFGGREVMKALRLLGAPPRLRDAAHQVLLVTGETRRKRWEAFCATYDDACSYHGLTRTEGDSSGPS